MVHTIALIVAVSSAAVPVQSRPSVLTAPLPEVEQRGTGDQAMILIPCAACGWWAFEGFMERNADRYRMYAVTLPGYGATPDPGLPIDTEGTPWHDNAVARLSELIDTESLQDVVVLGHSFGSTIAVELAAARPDVVTGVVNLDGGLTSNRSWFPDDASKRRRAADELTASNVRQYADPTAWRSFNLPTILDPERRLLYHGMFMGTSRVATFQYWRENMIKDLNPLLRGLDVPVLDVQAIAPTSSDPEGSRRAYEESLREDRLPASVRTVWAYETFHQMVEHRPDLVDRMVAEWLAGTAPADFRPDGYVANVPDRVGVPLDPGLARAYEGAYSTVLGAYDFAVRGSALVLILRGSELALTHLGAHRFALEASPRLTVTFDMADGRAAGFRYQSPGRGLDLRGARVSAPPP